MATNTLGVIGIDITTHGGISLLDPENSILRAENDAAVTLETHTATHATVGFQLSLFFRQALDTFTKGAQYGIGRNGAFITFVSCLVLEMTKE